MLELNKIYLGDSNKLLLEIDNKSVDLIIIDPPYELETERGGGFFADDNPNKRQYQGEIEKMMDGISNDFLDLLLSKQKRVNCYIFCSRTQMIKMVNYAITHRYNWELLKMLKTNPIPTCNNKYLSDTEYIVFMREPGVKLFTQYETSKTYFICDVNKDDKFDYKHPTIKPLSIIKTLIINSSQENDLVLDCFSGSGTTCVAAKELNRSFIGIEIDPIFHKISTERLNGIKANGQTSIFTDFGEIK